MKHLLFTQSLKALRKITRRLQIGNPAGKAPALLPEPSEAEKIRVRLPGFEQIFAWRLKNALCCGLYHGAVMDGQNQMYLRLTVFPWGKELHPSLCSPYLGSQLARLDKAIFMMTPVAKGNYYHWIADLLPRLLLVQACGLADFHQRSIILHQPARSYESDTLSLLNISSQQVVRLKSFQTLAVADLMVADYLHSRDGQAFPLWKKQLLDGFKAQVLGTALPLRSRRIYLLRGRQRTRRLLGEERLVEVLQQLGFQILDPQQMSLLEQMQALSEAEVVVGLHGAALVNIIFCQPGTLVVELRSSFKPPEHYSNIAQTYQLQFQTVCLQPEKVVQKPNLALQQNLILGPEALEALLAKLQLCKV